MIDFWVNGQSVRRAAQSARSLMACLRDDLRLTGTKDGCNGAGHCGTCTVLIDGQPALACRVPLDEVDGKRVLTIEGLADSWKSEVGGQSPTSDFRLPTSNLHPLQQSFIEHHAVQCGFCAPGMILAAKALLDRNLAPSLAEIKDALACNLCRCTGYQKIFEAIQALTPRPLARLPSPLFGDGRGGVAIGHSVPNKGDEAKVLGEAIYSNDFYREGMLIGKAVWSEHPHAEIVSIDTAAAQAMPGVAAVLTAKDVRGTNLIGPILRDQPALAEG